jgi:phage tail protein X
LPVVVTFNSTLVGGGVTLPLMVAVQVAAVPSTIVTVPVLPVPVQPALQATVSVALVGVAVRVTAPAGNLAVQGAAEVQALMPVGVLVTLPLPTTVTVKSVPVGVTLPLMVAVQVAGVPATIVTFPVLLPRSVQPLLQATVSVALVGVAVRVTSPAWNLAVQGAAEVQALIPEAELLVTLPLPTTVTVRSVPANGLPTTPYNGKS